MTDQIYIIPDRDRKKYPDPDKVAAEFSKQVEEELRRKALEERLKPKQKQNLEKKVEKEKVEKTGIPASLEEICKGYEKFMAWKDRAGEIPTEITDKYNPTSEQIKQFSKNLIKYKDLEGFITFTANYLTALMHSSQDKEFVIDLTELNKENIRLNFLGIQLINKKLTINGDVGNGVGYEAKNCQITVNGNAGDWVGSYAKKCQIKIKGKIKSLSDYIGKGTEIYQWKNNSWEKIYSK